MLCGSPCRILWKSYLYQASSDLISFMVKQGNWCCHSCQQHKEYHELHQCILHRAYRLHLMLMLSTCTWNSLLVVLITAVQNSLLVLSPSNCSSEFIILTTISEINGQDAGVVSNQYQTTRVTVVWFTRLVSNRSKLQRQSGPLKV